MHILQILPESHLDIEIIGIVDLARYLYKDGHKVIVLSSPSQRRLLQGYNLKTYELPIDGKSIFTRFIMVSKLVNIIRKEKIQIVHTHSPLCSLIAFFACFKSGAHLVSTCHKYYKKNYYNRIMGLGKLVIAPSNVIAKNLVDFGRRHQDIRIIASGIDIERLQFVLPQKKRLDQFIVSIISDLRPEKGHQYFLKAMAKAYQIIPNLRVWIVGETSGFTGSYKEQLKTFSKRFGISHLVDFLGYHYDSKELFSKINILVIASTQEEGFSNIVVQAQASGVPVIATKIPGLIEIIKDNLNGLLVPPGDSKAIYEAVVELSRDIHKQNILSQNARKEICRNYSLDKTYNKMVSVYNECLSNIKILLIQPDSLKNVFLSTPLLRAIRKTFPNARIYNLLGLESAKLLSNSPYIDEILVFAKRGRAKKIIYFIKLILRLVSLRFDIVIDLQNCARSHIIAFLTFAQNRLGFDTAWQLSFLLNKKIKVPKEKLSPFTRQSLLLQALNTKIEDFSLEIWPNKQDKLYIENILEKEWISDRQKLVGINVSFNIHNSSLRFWHPSYLIKLCQELAKKHIRIVLTGIEEDLLWVERIFTTVESSKPIILCGKTTINQLISLIEKCNVYISDNSLPLYIAVATNTPFIALCDSNILDSNLTKMKRFICINYDNILHKHFYNLRLQTKQDEEKIKTEYIISAIEKLL